MTAPRTRIEYVALTALLKTRDKRNPKTHDIDGIRASIITLGFVEPVVRDGRTGKTIAGHGRLETLDFMKTMGDPLPSGLAISKGEWLVPVTVGWSSTDDAHAAAALVALNRQTERGGWNDEALSSLLSALDGDLLSVAGFDQGDLDDLLSSLDAGTRRFAKRNEPIDDLHPHPRNYRKHPADQLEHLASSIRTYGLYRTVIVARDGTILAGHGVVEALRLIGRATVPAVRLDLAPDDPLALKLLAGDNEITNLADVDDRSLTELLRELAAGGVEGLIGTGFDAQQLAALAMVTRSAAEIQDHDAASEWVGLPGFTAAPPTLQVNVKFDSEDDRKQFIELVGAVHLHYRTPEIWTIWWPDRPRADLNAVRFQ